MSRDGSGNYSLVSGNPVTTNTVISSTWANLTLSDIAAALTQSLSKDGQTTPTANLTMGNFRLISLAAGTNRTDAVNVGQVQDNTPAVLSSIGGTGDAITAATTPAIASYATDAKFVYTPTTTNTLTNPTIAIDGLAAKTITQSNGIGLWAGALVVGTPYELLYDGTNFRIQSGQLGSPIVPMGSSFAFRNRFIDGSFDFWDTGTSTAATATPNYVSSIWCYACGTSGAATVSQGTFAAGAEPTGWTSPSKSFMQIAQTVGGNTAPAFSHRIENVTTFDGRSATLSVWMWVNSGTLSLTNIFVNQNFGTGGSANVITNVPVAWTLTTTPTRFSVRIDVPSISGKTIGTASDFLGCNVTFPITTTFNVNVGQAQIEDCPAGAPAAGLPTPFEKPPFAITRTMISRYLNLIKCSARWPATALNQLFDCTVSYPPMRATPAATQVSAGTSGNLATQSIASPDFSAARYEIGSSAGGDCFALGYIYMFDARI
jgi:hypothetical protein